MGETVADDAKELPHRMKGATEGREVRMQYRELGRTGCRVSVLGLGCMRLPVVNDDPKHIDEEEAQALVRAAIDRGVNYIDTAYTYHGSESEPFVGRVLANGLRDRVFVATKLPSWLVQEESDFDRLLAHQLERLQTDHIDFYLMHALKRDWWSRMKEVGVRKALDRALADGRIRHAGFSYHDGPEHFAGVVDDYDWSFCQIQYNYMDEEFQAGTAGLRYAASRGLGVIVMEPLRGGGLAAKMPPGVARLMEDHPVRRSPAEWALRWVWNHPKVGVALSGVNCLEHLDENCRVAEEALPQSLTPADLGLVARVRDQFRKAYKIPCTACGYCMPCGSGVNIPHVFSIYNNYALYGDKLWARAMYNSVTPEAERAPSCVGCGECEAACPQRISIIEGLKECDEVLTRLTLP